MDGERLKGELIFLMGGLENRGLREENRERFWVEIEQVEGCLVVSVAGELGVDEFIGEGLGKGNDFGKGEGGNEQCEGEEGERAQSEREGCGVQNFGSGLAGEQAEDGFLGVEAVLRLGKDGLGVGF